MNDRKLTVKEAALYLGLSQSTLNQWRMTGKGPAFYKLSNRIVYPESALIAFLNRNMHGEAIANA